MPNTRDCARATVLYSRRLGINATPLFYTVECELYNIVCVCMCVTRNFRWFYIRYIYIALEGFDHSLAKLQKANVCILPFAEN